MLNCSPHAIPPAMQCYGVVAGTRTLAVPDLLHWELHVSRGVVSMLSARSARSTPQQPPWGGDPRHAWYEGVLARSHGLVFSSAAGGAHWQIAIRCPSLPFPSVKVHQAAVLVRRFCSGGGLGPKSLYTKNGPTDFSNGKFRFFPRWSLWSGKGGGVQGGWCTAIPILP